MFEELFQKIFLYYLVCVAEEEEEIKTKIKI